VGEAGGRCGGYPPVRYWQIMARLGDGWIVGVLGRGAPDYYIPMRWFPERQNGREWFGRTRNPVSHRCRRTDKRRLQLSCRREPRGHLHDGDGAPHGGGGPCILASAPLYTDFKPPPQPSQEFAYTTAQNSPYGADIEALARRSCLSVASSRREWRECGSATIESAVHRQHHARRSIRTSRVTPLSQHPSTPRQGPVHGRKVHLFILQISW